MAKTVKEINKIIESAKSCVNYVEHYMPERNEHDLDSQCKIVEHLVDYIEMLENMEVKA